MKEFSGDVARHHPKTGLQTISDHSQNVSKLASEFADIVSMPNVGKLLGIVHDVGKYSEAFQNYLLSSIGKIEKDNPRYVNPNEKMDHSSIGGKLIMDIAPHGSIEETISWYLAGTTSSHHTGLIDFRSVEGKDVFGKRIGKFKVPKLPTSLQEDVERLFNLSIYEYKEFIDRINENARSKLQGLSKKERESLGRSCLFQISMVPRLLLSCLVDADRIDAQAFSEDKQPAGVSYNPIDFWEKASRIVEDAVVKFPRESKLNRVRGRISDACKEASDMPPGIFSLTAPTGGGKTISSLRFALNHAKKHGLERIIYVAPYTTIVEQTADSLRKVLGECGESVLEYHSYVTDNVLDNRSAPIDNWDYPIVVTTMVQFLDALFGHGASKTRRMHRLTNSVLIFDEIQAIPTKCIHMFNSAINFLTEFCKSSALLCTATQPLLDKVPVSLGKPTEIIDDKKGVFSILKRVEADIIIKPMGWNAKEIADKAKLECETHGNVLVILSTKRAAREVFASIECDVKKHHLSTDMCPEHRADVLKTIKSKLALGEKLICVSTQLIEAGVDIDFATVIRSVAGLDSLQQAAGRCNREGKRLVGKVTIVNPSQSLEIISGNDNLYFGKKVTFDILDATDSVERKELLSNPSVMEEYFSNYLRYCSKSFDYPVDGSSTKLFHLLGGSVENTEAEVEGSENMPVTPYSYAYSMFKVIDDSETVPVIVHYGISSKIIEKISSKGMDGLSKEDIRTLQRYTVNMFAKDFSKAEGDGKITRIGGDEGINILDEEMYDLREGLKK